MNIAVRSILVLLSTVGCLIAPASSWADEPQFALNFKGRYEDVNNTSRVASISKVIPINRRYKEFTKAQRDEVKSAYEPMLEDDEPPFPEDGLEPTLRALIKVQSLLLVEGKLELVVDVGADGIATSISIQGSPSPGMTRFVSEYFMLTKYKPAVCGGQPCKMQYPFAMVFGVDAGFE